MHAVLHAQYPFTESLRARDQARLEELRKLRVKRLRAMEEAQAADSGGWL